MSEEEGPSAPSSEEIVRAAWGRLRYKSQWFVHAKSGKEYVLVMIALRERDLEPLAVYQNSFSAHDPAFVRPLDEFLAKFTPLEEWQCSND